MLRLLENPYGTSILIRVGFLPAKTYFCQDNGKNYVFATFLVEPVVVLKNFRPRKFFRLRDFTVCIIRCVYRAELILGR